MMDLGQWAPYIEPSMLSWYQLPDTMQAEASSYRPDGCELWGLKPETYARLRRQTVQFAQESVAPFQPAYHNSHHFLNVEALGLSAADAYAGSDRRHMSNIVWQMFSLALHAHDAFHSGSAFRMDARHGVHLPQLGVRVSTEWVTALSVNDFLRRQGVPFPHRLFVTGVIWSSTHGGNTPKGKYLKIPEPQPHLFWGRAMRAADVCPLPSYDEQLCQSVAVNYGEVPAAPVPHTVAGYVAAELGFMRYVELTFDRLDQVSGNKLTERLGWRHRLTTIREGLAKLQTGDRRLANLVRAEARRYGVKLG